MFDKKILLTALGSLALVAGSAHAAPVAVANAGFDYTMNGDGTGPFNEAGDAGNPAPLDSFTETHTAGVTSVGVATFGAGSTTGFGNNGTATFAGWDVNENAGDGGAQFLASSFWSTDPGSAVGLTSGDATLTQSIGGGLSANTVYTLTFDLYSRTGGFAITDADLVLAELQDGSGTAIAGVTTVVAGGTGQWSVTHVATSGAGASGDLTILLGNTGGGQYNYDNVALDAVPEPGSLALLGLGGLALLRRRRA